MQMIAYKYWFVNKDSHFYLIENATRWRLYQMIHIIRYKTNRMKRFPPFLAPCDMEKFCDILFQKYKLFRKLRFFGMMVSLGVWFLFRSLWNIFLSECNAALFSFPKYGICSIIASTAIFLVCRCCRNSTKSLLETIFLRCQGLYWKQAD